MDIDMRKIISNNKGYMLVEIIVASVIALIMAYFLIDITIKLVNKNNDYYIDSILLVDKNVITKEIMDDINGKKLTKVNCEDNKKCTLTYDGTEEKILEIGNNTISYGKYKKELSEYISLGNITLQNDSNFLTISIPAYTNYSKTDYGITIFVPYNEDIEIVYPAIADLIINNINLDKEIGFPSGSYTVNENCNGATASYDYSGKKLIISSIEVKQNAICSPILVPTTRTTLANYITKNLLNGQTSVKAASKNYTNETLDKINSQLDNNVQSTDYRYRGTNPDNYIWFNDEMWRIIGVFDDNSHGISNTYLVKIIRNDSIGSYVWDNSGTNGRNNWPTSKLYNMLNNVYYNAINGKNSDYCYISNTVKGKCDFTEVGLKYPYRDMVEEVTWYLGGYEWSRTTRSADMYMYERSQNTSSAYYTSGNSKTATGYVGLMYLSDYGYAAYNRCNNALEDYFDASSSNICSDKDWLKSTLTEWTITHQAGNSSYVYGYNVKGDVDFSGMTANSIRSVRPVVYLDTSVYYISGRGTQAEPYIIGM